MNSEPALNVAQTARRLNISPNQVRALISKNKLRAFDVGLGDRHEWRIEPHDIDVFISNAAKEPTTKLAKLPSLKISKPEFIGVRREKRAAMRKSS